MLVFENDSFQGSNVSLSHSRFCITSRGVNFYTILYAKLCEFTRKLFTLISPYLSGKFLVAQIIGAFRRLLVKIKFFSASEHAVDVLDFTPTTQRKRLKVSTATNRYFTPKFSLESCCI